MHPLHLHSVGSDSAPSSFQLEEVRHDTLHLFLLSSPFFHSMPKSLTVLVTVNYADDALRYDTIYTQRNDKSQDETIRRHGHDSGVR